MAFPATETSKCHVREIFWLYTCNALAVNVDWFRHANHCAIALTALMSSKSSLHFAVVMARQMPNIRMCVYQKGRLQCLTNSDATGKRKKKKKSNGSSLQSGSFLTRAPLYSPYLTTLYYTLVVIICVGRQRCALLISTCIVIVQILQHFLLFFICFFTVRHQGVLKLWHLKKNEPPGLASCVSFLGPCQHKRAH